MARPSALTTVSLFIASIWLSVKDLFQVSQRSFLLDHPQAGKEFESDPTDFNLDWEEEDLGVSLSSILLVSASPVGPRGTSLVFHNFSAFTSIGEVDTEASIYDFAPCRRGLRFPTGVVSTSFCFISKRLESLFLTSA